MLSKEIKKALNDGNYLLLTIGDKNIVIDKNTSLTTIMFEYGDELDMTDLIEAEFKIIGGQ